MRATYRRSVLPELRGPGPGLLDTVVPVDLGALLEEVLEVVEHGAQQRGAVLGEAVDARTTVARPLEVSRRHLVVVRLRVGLPDLV